MLYQKHSTLLWLLSLCSACTHHNYGMNNTQKYRIPWPASVAALLQQDALTLPQRAYAAYAYQGVHMLLAITQRNPTNPGKHYVTCYPISRPNNDTLRRIFSYAPPAGFQNNVHFLGLAPSSPYVAYLCPLQQFTTNRNSAVFKKLTTIENPREQIETCHVLTRILHYKEAYYVAWNYLLQLNEWIKNIYATATLSQGDLQRIIPINRESAHLTILLAVKHCIEPNEEFYLKAITALEDITRDETYHFRAFALQNLEEIRAILDKCRQTHDTGMTEEADCVFTAQEMADLFYKVYGDDECCVDDL